MKECWLIPGNRKRALLSIGLMVCQQWTGTNAINYYAPTIFTNLGVKGNSQSLFATGVYGIVKMSSCAIFITFLADTLGRKWSLVWTAFFMWFCMFYLGFYVRFDPPIKGAAIPAAGYVALVVVYLFAAAFQVCASPETCRKPPLIVAVWLGTSLLDIVSNPTNLSASEPRLCSQRIQGHVSISCHSRSGVLPDFFVAVTSGFPDKMLEY